MTNDDLAELPATLAAEIHSVLNSEPPMVDAAALLRKLEDMLNQNEKSSQYYRGLLVKYSHPYYSRDRLTLTSVPQEMDNKLSCQSHILRTAIDAIQRHERGA